MLIIMLCIPTTLSDCCLRYRCHNLPAELSVQLSCDLLTQTVHSAVDSCL